MIKRTIVWQVLVCLLLVNNGFAQTKAKPEAAEIFAYSQEIAKAAKEKIWIGFDVRRYAALKSDSGSNLISFTSEPDNPSPPVFWQLTDEYFLNHALEENLVITFHEAFHGFERDPKRAGAKWRAENSLLIFEYAETSARNNALFNVESRILYSALQSGNPSELKQKARQFLAVRKLRQSELEPRFAEFEKGAESNEGLAEYAGTKAVVVGMEAARRKKISVPFANSDAKVFLIRKFEKLNSIMNVGRNARLKFYYTGSAQAFLLDRLMPDWKTKVQMKGAALQDLLEESVNLKTAPHAIDAVLQQYDYEKILREEETTVAQRKASNKALLDSILTQKGLRFVIDYSASERQPQIQSFDPMNVTMITPKVRLHTRMVRFANNNTFTVDFSQPVIEDFDNKRYVTVVSENEIPNIIVDGESFDPAKASERRFDNNLLITAAKFKLEAAAAGTIKVKDNEITVKLSK